MTTVAFLASSVLGIVLAALREHFDRGFRTGRELRAVAWPIPLGFVPDPRSGATARPHRGPAREAAFEVRRGSQGHHDDDNVIAQPSARHPGDLQLAGRGQDDARHEHGATLARSGHKTVVVDLDLRNPGLARELGHSIGAGIVEYLEGEGGFSEIFFIRMPVSPACT